MLFVLSIFGGVEHLRARIIMLVVRVSRRTYLGLARTDFTLRQTVLLVPFGPRAAHVVPFGAIVVEQRFG